jgi:hypothetical protein
MDRKLRAATAAALLQYDSVLQASATFPILPLSSDGSTLVLSNLTLALTLAGLLPCSVPTRAGGRRRRTWTVLRLICWRCRTRRCCSCWVACGKHQPRPSAMEKRISFLSSPFFRDARRFPSPRGNTYAAKVWDLSLVAPVPNLSSRSDSHLSHRRTAFALHAQPGTPAVGYRQLSRGTYLLTSRLHRYRDIGRLACVCRGLRSLVTGDALGDMHWQKMQCGGRRHPPHAVAGSWRRAFAASLQLDGAYTSIAELMAPIK